MAEGQQTASWSELLRGGNGLRTLALAGGVAVHAINMYIVATILPSVVQDIGGLPYYSWNMTLFVVASILTSALSPRLIVTCGPRHAFLLALGVFSLGTVFCALAPRMGWMLIGRTLQGLGGGALLGLSYSSVRIVFPERLWPKTTALLSSMWGLATLCGPAIGGMFAQAGLWRWSFWSVIVAAFGLALAVQSQIAVKASTPQQSRSIAFVQIGLMMVSVLVVSVASLSPQTWRNLLGVAVGALLTAVIVRVDRRSRNGNDNGSRLMPDGAYELLKMGGAYACTVLLSVSITMEMFVPYFLQVLHGQTPLAAGYLAAVMSVGWTLGTFYSASRNETAVQRMLRFGPTVTAVCIVLLALLTALPVFDDRLIAASAVLIPLLGTGMGMGICWPHLLTHIYKTAPAGQENMASSAVITVQLYAMAFGAALGGMIANAAGFIDPGGVEGTRSAALALLLSFALPPALSIYFALWLARARMRWSRG